ncbi:hypothetical protein DSO57_1014386 [Entomophthora muscae]|uniref:Uncharacterized protein n=1 Tax=Entomophthora muscae TaxID=34485 RepID=A0ACC2TG07_9FUNG|nr:hypothetical protein DSO57_1014386 [Entomophthora muscae]
MNDNLDAPKSQNTEPELNHGQNPLRTARPMGWEPNNPLLIDKAVTSPPGPKPLAVPQDSASKLTPASYVPPARCSLWTFHFTEYPFKPEYKDYTANNILAQDPLVRTTELTRYNQEGPWYVTKPRLFRDKYNFLPAYQMDMEPPVTPKPMPASTAKLPLDHTNKLFGIVYITLDKERLWGSFKYGIKKEEKLDCGRDLVGVNLGVGHVRDGFKPLDTWTVM